MTVFAAIAIFIGAGSGALLRWLLGSLFNPLFPTLPLGTLAANLLGGFLIGVILAWSARHPGLPPEIRLFLITGFLGGLTTFSTFSAEVVNLLSRREWLWGIIAINAHLIGSLTLTAAGLGIAHWLMLRGGLNTPIH
ncbi:fluoride efflux transporter CrcB [Rhodoferax sp. 4810]|uniref:Fluoride-specific ion channel FluC n=1 Tax=Thiospirillum jenense TaxID=1653858 RepID=A0A839H843_9GAMM|nr:fluoride efflux transporter CrcB [Thiospirillum jenense]MBB1073801.1 fluoride efflux transporter CrcB [Rhodoferax jenense]MBB1125244.1 fluoride efflux transporter CrcB [Thiospirillum jenense]